MSSSRRLGARPNRSAFIRGILDQDPDASYDKVNEAWLAAGNAERMSAVLYYQIKVTFLRPQRRAKAPVDGRRETTAAMPIPPPAPAEVYSRRDLIVAAIKYQLSRLPYLRTKAQKYRSRVSQWKWHSDRSELTCHVQGRQRSPYRVTIRVRQRSARYLVEGCCTCPASSGIAPCKHVYAALENLLSRSQLINDPVFTEAFGETAPQRVGPTNLLQALDAALGQQENLERLENLEAKRLVWRVGFDHHGNRPTVEAYEQTRTVNGEWSAGRRLTLQNLWSLHAYPSEWRQAAKLMTADVSVLHALRRNTDDYPYSSRVKSRDDLAPLECLAGHPLLFWEDSPAERIEIQRGELSLSVQPAPDGVRVAINVNGQSTAELADQCVVVPEQGSVWFDRKNHRVIVARTSSKALGTLLPSLAGGVTVPANQTSELLLRLARLEPFVPISAPEDFVAPEIVATIEPVLRLMPLNIGGMKAQLRLRGLAGGEGLIPGEGEAAKKIVAENKWQTIRRDLEQERTSAAALAAELGLTENHRTGPWDWLLPTDDDALDFLSSLRERNLEGLSVEWPAGMARSVVGTLSASALRVRIDDRRDWFGLSGHIELDGAKVSIADILKAVQRGQSYVSLGDGKWAKIEAEFRKRLEALSDVVHSHPKGLEIDRTAFAVVDELEIAARELKVCRSWQKMVDRLRADDSLDAEPPISVQADLRPYQVEGFRWLRKLATWGVGACLADDMGLGKTLEALAILVERAESGPALVLTPASVGFNWMAETERFAPTLRPIYYRETDRERIVKRLRDGDLLIVSYGLLRQDIDLLASRKWGTIVLDEAQNVKNSQTRTAQAVRQLKADWRLALTGTPVENHLGELWSIFRAISPGLLGSWERFKERFADPIERRQDFDRQQALARVLRPFLLRRTKEEVLKELPSRTETQYTVELSKAERKRYEDARLAALLQLADGDASEDKRFQVLAALTRLRQLACHPRLVDSGWKKSSAKLECLMELIDEIREGGHRALVFSQFVQHLGLIREALDKKGIDYQYLDGQTPVRERKKRVEAFQDGKGELFLISLKAGGTGLNLTGADYVIHMDPWWNPAVEDQATDRAHRIGQTKPVTVYRIVAKGTIEEQILSLHQEKRDLIAGVLDGSDRAAKLSTEQLVDLIRGREEAVSAIA